MLNDIHAGMRLRYAGYEQTPSVLVRAVMLPGRPEYDGGLPGVSFRYLKRPGHRDWFYACRDVREFVEDIRFRNLEPVTADEGGMNAGSESRPSNV